MITNDQIDAIIAERYRLSKIYDDEWAYPIQLCWAQLTELFALNMDETIDFLDNRCTADEFGWISDVFDYVAEETQSKEFIAALYRLAEKYPEEVTENNLMFFIEDAESKLKA